MILAIDVYYFENKAKSVGLIFNDWNDDQAKETVFTYVENVEEYESGAFYKRELPCILQLLEKIDLTTIQIIIIDGYVYLNDDKKLGMGGYLYESLEHQIPIIGVAKHPFHNNKKNVREVYRGESKNPLYVSAVGIDIIEAAEQIQHMSGTFRVPKLLKLLDQETKVCTKAL